MLSLTSLFLVFSASHQDAKREDDKELRLFSIKVSFKRSITRSGLFSSWLPSLRKVSIFSPPPLSHFRKGLFWRIASKWSSPKSLEELHYWALWTVKYIHKGQNLDWKQKCNNKRQNGDPWDGTRCGKALSEGLGRLASVSEASQQPQLLELSKSL